eukprot:TRINITY_DN11342_c0_g1_i1.p1 TRINITY_DN11342_c0_g1~~TRINITY_DN11342_c0_g1_i1.p1  ORF type:complete len:334 (+),score=35.43 TRINITY_DN11342_c0_g1_i1:121-1122(+)
MPACWEIVLSSEEPIVLSNDVLNWLQNSSDIVDFHTKLRATCEDKLERNAKCSRLKLETVKKQVSHVLGKYYNDASTDNIINTSPVVEPAVQQLCRKIATSLTTYPTSNRKDHFIYFNTLLLAIFDISLPRSSLENIARRTHVLRTTHHSVSAKKAAQHMLLLSCICWALTPSSRELFSILHLLGLKGGAPVEDVVFRPLAFLKKKQSGKQKQQSLTALKNFRRAMRTRPRTAPIQGRSFSPDPVAVKLLSKKQPPQPEEESPAPTPVTSKPHVVDVITQKTEPLSILSTSTSSSRSKVPSWCFIPPKNRVFRGRMRPGPHSSDTSVYCIKFR